MNNKKIVVINPNMSIDQKNLISETAAKYGETVDFYDTNRDAIPNLGDAEIIYGFGPDLASNAPNLKWFCSSAAGVDMLIKSGEFQNRDILLTNSSGSYGLSISEHIIMVSLMMMRRFPEYSELIANKQWRNDLEIKSLSGSKIVVLGTGNIGSTFAKRVRGFDPSSIIGVSRSGKALQEFDKVYDISQLDDVISDVDLLVLALPGTPETENILSKERIARLPATSYVVNVGRGSAIDDEALMDALNQGKLAGAALDVFKKEPIPQDSPLWNTKNLLVTPHISGQETLDWTRENNCRMFVNDMENYFQGKPLSQLVDISAGY